MLCNNLEYQAMLQFGIMVLNVCGGGVRRGGGGRGARIKAGPKSGDVCLLWGFQVPAYATAIEPLSLPAM